MTQELGIEQARKVLGEIADRARYSGERTYLTRSGRRIAAIVPLEAIMSTYTYRIDTSDDGQTWMPYSDDARGTEQSDSTPREYAVDVLAAHLDELTPDGGVQGMVRVLVWDGPAELEDRLAVATAEHPSA